LIVDGIVLDYVIAALIGANIGVADVDGTDIVGGYASGYIVDKIVVDIDSAGQILDIAESDSPVVVYVEVVVINVTPFCRIAGDRTRCLEVRPV
jgi:hypothetical protein